MTTGSAYWELRRNARKRWSLNAVRKRAQLRMDRNENAGDESPTDASVPKTARFDLRVTLERRDGGKIQFTLHHYKGKLIGNSMCMSPKQFGRKLGNMFDLWCKE